MREEKAPIDSLTRISLLQGIDRQLTAGIAARMRMGRYRTGETVLQRADASSDIYFLFAGSVSVKSFSDDGQEVSFLRIEAPSVFGEFSAIDHRARSADVLAMSDIEVGRMSASEFQALIIEFPRIGLNLAAHLVGKIRGLTNRIFEFSAYPVAIRVRRALLRLAANGVATHEGLQIKPAPTHAELANMLATHREAISRELSFLAKQGVIQSGRKSITLLDKAALGRLAGEDEP